MLVSFGTIDDEEKEDYEKQLNHVEPLFPVRWLGEEGYWVAKYSHLDEYYQLVDSNDMLIRFQLNKKFDPLSVIGAPQPKKRSQNNDPDAPYFGSVDTSVFVDFEERHKLEKEDPLLYGQYSIIQCPGCPHGQRGAKLICPECQEVCGCEICHNENAFDHEIKWKDVQEVECINCKLRQPISEKCTSCGQQFSNCFCPQCKNVYILDPQTEPWFHCERCGQCHLFSHPSLSSVCEKCKQCVSAKDRQDHCCEPDVCCVCQGVIYQNFDFVQLPCNSRHRMHELCFQRFLNKSESGTCPLCRRLISPEQHLMRQKQYLARSIYEATLVSPYLPVGVFQCRECSRTEFNCFGGFCIYCWLDNVDIVWQNMVQIIQVQAHIKNTAWDEVASTIQLPKEHLQRMVDFFLTTLDESRLGPLFKNIYEQVQLNEQELATQIFLHQNGANFHGVGINFEEAEEADEEDVGEYSADQRALDEDEQEK